MSSLRVQKVLMYVFIGLATVWGFDIIFLLPMVPPPSELWTPDQIAQFYVENGGRIRLGAVLSSWTGGCILAVCAVISVQMLRHERGRGKTPVLTLLALIGGALSSVFTVFPPLIFGLTAFDPHRSKDVTAALHHAALLSYVTTDQWYIFWCLPIAAICLIPHSVKNSPFPRWFGYYTIFFVIVDELSCLPFLFRSGPLAWNGLLAWWAAIIGFAIWISIFCVLLLKAINAQLKDENEELSLSPAAAPLAPLAPTA